MRRIFAVLILFFFGLPALLAQAPSRRVLVIPFEDTVQPVSSDYLIRGIHQAAEEGDDAVLIELNTPGGLLDSTRKMVGAILTSPVPVIVFVGPAGARAGSAGFFLLESADLAAMAPGTNAGAAHPVNGDGTTMDPVMKEKLENDTAAFLRSFVNERHRNQQAAEDAVRKSLSYSEWESLADGLIDLVAQNNNDLLRQADGRSVQRPDGKQVVLHTAGAQRILFQPTVRERVLGPLMNPNLALLILVAGVLLIYVEFNSPGTIVPGSLGALCVLLALFALNLLPLRYTAVALLLAALILIVLEVKYTSHGVLALAGICSMILGSLTLVAAPIPELTVHWPTAVALALAFGGITVVLLRLAIRARRNKSKLGSAALIGETAVAMETLAPEGQVLVHGELWHASAAGPVEKGCRLRVTGTRGLILVVEPETAAETVNKSL
jgi:membrane-bound serine protease (ClpP class)